MNAVLIYYCYFETEFITFWNDLLIPERLELSWGLNVVKSFWASGCFSSDGSSNFQRADILPLFVWKGEQCYI